jgi:prepilin-type N-terminal cleavage/methylation domain-containing protein
MLRDLQNNQGFSLVELSIVLVILGLLTGGILTGQNLIRAAELRSVTTEFQTYQTAVMTFRDKYFALPGDMRNATDFWGAVGGGGGGVACFGAESSDGATCNGNSDGYTGYYAGFGPLYAWGERFHFWVQLSNAGLVEGAYTGVTDSGADSYTITPGKNVPTAKYGGSMWDVYGRAGVSGSANVFDDSGGLIFTLRTVADQEVSPLKPNEIWNIDKKIDDGRPAYGKIRTHKKSSSAAPDCSTTDVANTAKYSLENMTARCVFFAYF